ncbi:MAG TPA: amidase family protein [Balneolales bacterium]|nr:amidase family protein [Balneolales bacterium]
MAYNNIEELQKAVKKGEISLKEVVSSYLDEINQRNDDVNAFISVYPDQAKKRAEEVEKKLKDGTAGPLAGAIMGIKDLICEKGKQATCASHILEKFESVYDATVIEKLNKNDAILLGRLNMDEFAMGSSNENSIYGPAKNPNDTTKVPGGSSGGSAAAVGAGFCNTSLGSDTGGSIRQPASFCGVVGLKPTYGRVSRYGLIAFASSLDCIGPLATNTYDAALILNSIAGRDPHDGTTADVPVPDYTQTVKDPDSKIKVGVPDLYFSEGLDPEINTRIKDTIKALEKEGAELVPVDLSYSKYAIATYYILATAEASSNLARYDGIRYGHRADINKVKDDLRKEEEAITQSLKAASDSDKAVIEEELKKMDTPLIRLYKQSRTEGFGTEVKRRIMLGTYVLSAGYYDAYYGKAQKMRRLIKEDFERAFKNVDVIVSPTNPTTAFDIGSKVDDPLQMYLNDIYTISANLAGICGINVPVGNHSNGLPIGLQFMANTFEEERLLNAARLVERQFES